MHVQLYSEKYDVSVKRTTQHRINLNWLWLYGTTQRMQLLLHNTQYNENNSNDLILSSINRMYCNFFSQITISNTVSLATSYCPVTGYRQF